MPKIYLTATPRRGTTSEKARDDALEALSRSELIEKADGSAGIFGKLRRRDYKKERGS